MIKVEQIFKVLKTKIYFPLVIGLFLACVEPFELKIITTENILIVDGTIDDSDTDQFINLKKFVPSNSGTIRYVSEKGAKVKIIENGLKCTSDLKKSWKKAFKAPNLNSKKQFKNQKNSLIKSKMIKKMNMMTFLKKYKNFQKK
jgi:hypothetical protein